MVRSLNVKYGRAAVACAPHPLPRRPKATLDPPRRITQRSLGCVIRSRARRGGLAKKPDQRRVRFGSLADIAAAFLNVRFTPEADITESRRHVR